MPVNADSPDIALQYTLVVMVAAQIEIVQGRDGRARGVDLSRKAILKAIFAVLDGGTNGDDPVANVIDLRGTVLELELRGASAVIYVHLQDRSEEHTSELQSLMRISYAVFCLKKKKQ